MNVLIIIVTVLVVFGILHALGARQNRQQAASAAPAFSVEYETDFWEALYREFSCDWQIRDGELVIDYEIKNPTNWPWYGESTVTLCALIFDAGGGYKSARKKTLQDYELRLFSCTGSIHIPLEALEDGDSIRLTVMEEYNRKAASKEAVF